MTTAVSVSTGASMGRKRFDRLLGTLKKSVLFSEDFPRRRRLSHAEWAALGEEKRGRSYDVGLLALDRVDNAEELADAVDQLGEARHARAARASNS